MIVLLTIPLTLLNLGFAIIFYDDTLKIFSKVSLLTLLLIAQYGVVSIYKNHQPVVIEKSSDSDWEYSTNQSIKSDTTITEIKILNGTDTIYPTRYYKVIKR